MHSKRYDTYEAASDTMLFIYIGRHNWKHLGRNQDTDGDKSTNDGEQKGPYKGEETKAQEEKV